MVGINKSDTYIGVSSFIESQKHIKSQIVQKLSKKIIKKINFTTESLGFQGVTN